MTPSRHHSVAAFLALMAMVSLLLPGGVGEGLSCAHHGALQVHQGHASGVDAAFNEEKRAQPALTITQAKAPQTQGACPFCAPSITSLDAPGFISLAAREIDKPSLQGRLPLGEDAPRPPPLLSAPKLGPPARA